MLSITGNGSYAPLAYFFVALAVAAFVVEAWAFIDGIIRPAPAFVAAGKLTKPLWLIILGVAFVLGLYSAAYGGAVGFLSGSPSSRPRSTWPMSGRRSASSSAAARPTTARTVPGKSNSKSQFFLTAVALPAPSTPR